MKDQKLNGFNNGRDMTDGVGGRTSLDAGDVLKQVMTDIKRPLSYVREELTPNCNLFDGDDQWIGWLQDETQAKQLCDAYNALNHSERVDIEELAQEYAKRKWNVHNSQAAEFLNSIEDFKQGFMAGSSLPHNEWVSVSDGLPDDDSDVWVSLDGNYNNEVSVGCYRKDLHNWCVARIVGGRIYTNDAVTHWMPLPENPNK